MESTTTSRPTRARAVFSTEDFELLRDAVMTHLQRPDVRDSAASIKYSNLFHRLGRLS